MTDFTNEQLIAYLQDELKLLREVSAKLPRTTALKMDIVIHEAALTALTSAPVVPEECPAAIRDLMASHSDDLFDDADAQQIWDACRAAMITTVPGKES